MEFLNNQGYELIWTILGEKQVVGGYLARGDDMIGNLIINGTYRLSGSGLKGGIRTYCDLDAYKNRQVNPANQPA